MNIKPILVSSSTSLNILLKKMDHAANIGLPPGILLVVDKKGSLTGTVSEGDIRRALLKFNSLDVITKDIMQFDPISFIEDSSINEILIKLPEELKKRGRKSRKYLGKIILVNSKMVPVSLLNYHQLWEQKVATHRNIVVMGLGYVVLV